MKKLAALLIFIWVLVAIAPAQQTIDAVGLTGTLVAPNGTPVNGQLTLALTLANVKNTCSGPPYMTVPRGPVTFTVTNGVVINGATANLVTQDCMSPRSAYYISVYDTNHKLLFADNWYFHEAAVINGHRSQDVGALVAVGFGGPIAVAISQGVFTNPQGNQTITQPAGTNLLINSAICTGTCIGFGGGGGTSGVTSVGLQLPSTVFNITTSPITSSGNLVAALSVQGANTIFGGPPTGTTSGVPSFRLLQSGDIPNNAANTSGTSGNVTGIVAIANGGTGTATPNLTPGPGISITGSWPNQTINDTAVGNGSPTQFAIYGAGNTLSGDPGITDNGTLITLNRTVVIPGLTPSQCISTDAGSHLTTVACGGGGSGANPGGTPGSIQYQVSSTVFGGVNITGLVKSNGSGAPTQASGTANLITGDYALPFSVTCTGSGLTCSYASNVFTWTLSGGAGSGTVNSGLAHQVGYYPAAAASVSGNPNLYTIDPSMSQSDINTLLAAVPSGSTILEQDNTVEAAQTNTNNIQVVDLSKGGHYIDLAKYGAACDGQHFTVTLTSGSNQVNVGSRLSAASIGQTMAIGFRTALTFNAPQYVWEPTITGYSNPNATLSGNAPFNFTGNVQVGTDNVAALTAAVADATYKYPILVHAGCNYLTSPVPFNGALTIIGQQEVSNQFVGMPGQDIFYQPDTIPGTNTIGWHIENVGFDINSTIDPTLPYTLYNTTATSSSTVQPFYRPVFNNGQKANNPMAPAWGTNLINGVANTTNGGNVVCVPTALGRLPVVGNYMIFPYLSTSVLWTQFVNNLTGAGCGGGFTGVTLSGTAPATATQAYWESGPPGNFNILESTIPTTITYPLTITVSLPNAPIPGFISNAAPRGHLKIGNDGVALEADYLGTNYATGVATATYILRRGPSTITTQMTATNAIVYPMNPCYANYETPPPVYPNINGSTSTTPATAETYPGDCVGNAAFAWPQLNSFSNPDPGPVDAQIGPLYIQVTDGQEVNGTTAFYQAGNTAGYSVNYPMIKIAYTEFGFVQGPASAANWGLTYHGVGPTGTGPHITDCQIHSTYPFVLADFSQGSIDRCDTYTNGINPYDGTPTGPGVALAMLYTLNEQTGGVVTTTFQDTIKDWNSEPDGSGGDEPVYSDIECNDCTFIQANFEGAFNIFGGSHIKYLGGQLSNPFINYGTNNHFENIYGVNTGLMTNIWDPAVAGAINWGFASSCSMRQGGLAGPLTNCGVGWNLSYDGRDTSAAAEGAGLNPWENAQSGEIVPGEWDDQSNLDSAPMSVKYVPDTTEPYWGSYAACNLGPSTFNACRVANWDGFNGGLFIGQHNRIYPGPVTIETNVKNATSSGTVTLTIQALDAGNGVCGGRAAQLQTVNLSLTNAWQHFSVPVNFVGKTGCVLQVQWGQGTINDQMRVGEFTMVPVPQMSKVAVATFTAGTACQRAGSWVGSDATNLYYCKGSAEGAGTIAALPYSGGGGSGGISGTLTNNFIPVATGTSTVTSSLLSDNGTTLAYGGSGGISVGGSSPGSLSFIANSSNIPALAANSAGFAGPNTGGTSFLYKLPGTAAVGFMFSAAPATNDGVNESAISVKHMEATITGGTNSFGTYGAGTVLGGTKTVNAGHFTNIQSVNTSLTTCTTAPTFNVIDRTTSALGVSSVGSTTGNIGGTGSTIDTAQTLAFAAGDDISVEVQVTGASCSNIFEVSAQYEVP